MNSYAKRFNFSGCLGLLGILMQTSGFATSTQFYPPELKPQLHAALQAQGASYQPRTEHLLANGQPAFVNRLMLEDSPYLQQHAHNPVHWYAWGEAAFTQARKLNKPIFLSIGYSTCHWCHVMERESFDNMAIAQVLNEHFISIKVDRERRPDVDAVYMTAVQLITGHGGWPMSSFLTPEGKTFLGGTYFPPQQFNQLLLKVNGLWQQRQTLMIEQAEKVAQAVNDYNHSAASAQKVDQIVTAQALEQIIKQYDAHFGGFGRTPKFPNETWLLYLLEFSRRSDNQQALAVVEGSLQAMARGGIYDHVAGGFHRYATDQHWLVPHFEKMLYNQALLARAYVLAYQQTGKANYARVAQQTLDYVLREMTSSAGTFYSATDADSAEGEGLYFLWTPGQLQQALKSDDAALAQAIYGVTEKGNFERRNILNLAMEYEAYAEKNKLSLTDLHAKMDRINQQLWQQRQQRVPPFRDDKILIAWNALMIHALCLAAEILDHQPYQQAAESAAISLWQSNRQDNGELWRINLRGKASIDAVSEDYAYLAEAFIALYDLNGEKIWLERAQQLSDLMITKFWDNQSGGFYMNTESASDNIMVRPKIAQDSTLPSANAVALKVLAALAKRLPEPKYRNTANITLAAFSSQIIQSPIAYTTMLMAATELNRGESGSRQYAGLGVVKIIGQSLQQDQQNQLKIAINIAPGWHINSHQPLQDYLIPTSIEVIDASSWQLGKIIYPEPEVKNLGFQRQSLSLYEQVVHLNIPVVSSELLPKQLNLLIKLQVCNYKICLAPEQLILNIPTVNIAEAKLH